MRRDAFPLEPDGLDVGAAVAAAVAEDRQRARRAVEGGADVDVRAREERLPEVEAVAAGVHRVQPQRGPGEPRGRLADVVVARDLRRRVELVDRVDRLRGPPGPVRDVVEVGRVVARLVALAVAADGARREVELARRVGQGRAEEVVVEAVAERVGPAEERGEALRVPGDHERVLERRALLEGARGVEGLARGRDEGAAGLARGHEPAVRVVVLAVEPRAPLELGGGGGVAEPRREARHALVRDGGLQAPRPARAATGGGGSVARAGTPPRHTEKPCVLGRWALRRSAGSKARAVAIACSAARAARPGGNSDRFLSTASAKTTAAG